MAILLLLNLSTFKVKIEVLLKILILYRSLFSSLYDLGINPNSDLFLDKFPVLVVTELEALFGVSDSLLF
jgi:hypothetical protein